MLRDFKAFVTKESMVNLGVAVVLAIAFGTLVRSLVANLLLPVLAVPGDTDFGDLAFRLGGGTFRYGAFLNDLVTFVLTAAGVFFCVVRPLARLGSASAAAPVETASCDRCLSTVPAAATRCPFCTSDLPGASSHDGPLDRPARARGAAAARRAGRAVRRRRRGRRAHRSARARAAAGAAAAGAARRARRLGAADPAGRGLLPLAALLDLSLLFPDAAPSRFRTALRAGSTRELTRTLQGPQRPAEAARTVVALLAALARHDRDTRRHTERVRAYTDLLGEALRLPQADRDRLRWAALLHDLGKLSVAPAVLRKPARLDDREWEVVRGHPAAGAELAAGLEPFLGEWFSGIRQHHERWDGGGYPDGLAGEQIGRAARIVAVADSFEVMTAGRSYRSAMPAEKARTELVAESGRQFDPAVVRALLDVSLSRLERVRGRWPSSPRSPSPHRTSRAGTWSGCRPRPPCTRARTPTRRCRRRGTTPVAERTTPGRGTTAGQLQRPTPGSARLAGMTTAFLGLGRMGVRMAAHLPPAGHDLRVWNRTPGRAGDLAPLEVETVEQAVDGADRVVADAVRPRRGARGAPPAGRRRPRRARRRQHHQRPGRRPRVRRHRAGLGLRYVEAPVAGSLAPAAEGTLGVFAGAAEADYADALPLLHLWGAPEKVRRVGEVGSGSALKLCVNQGLGVMAAGLGEALRLGQSSGSTAPCCSTSSAPRTYGWYLGQKRPMLESGDFGATTFSLELMAKDLRLAVTAARGELAVTQAVLDAAAPPSTRTAATTTAP